MLDTLNPNALMQNLTAAYGEAIQSTAATSAAQEEVNSAERTLELGRQDVLLQYKDNAKEMGANEATREAFIANKLAPAVRALHLAQEKLTQAKNAQKLAEMRLSQQRDFLRILEVMAHLPAGK